MSGLNVAFKISAIDDFSSTMKALDNQLRGVFDTIGQVGKAVSGMGLAVGAGLGFAANKAMDFEAQMSSVKSVMSPDEVAKFGDTLEQLAVQMGAETKYSALEAAQGIEELIKAGVQVTDIVNGGLKGALSLATAGELDLAEAAEIASTALNAFRDDGLSVTDAANILAGAANASATSVREMQYGLAQVASVASGLGLSFKDTSTALAVFAQNGLKGSDAGTSLKTMLSNLSPKSKAAYETMRELGIITKDGANAFFDAQGNIKSMAEIAGILQNALKGLNAEQRQQVLYTMFGSDAIRAANILYKEGAKGVEQMWASMSKVTAADVAAEKMNNVKGRIEELKGAVETAAISVGNALLPIINVIVAVLQKLVDWFNSLSPALQSTIAITAAFAAGLMLITGPLLLLIGFLPNIITGFQNLANVGKGLSAVMTFLTGPIGLTIAAILGLVTAAVIAYNKIDWFRESVDNAFVVIQNVVANAMSAVSSFIGEKLAQIRAFWQQNGEQIKRAATIVWAFLSGFIRAQMAVIQAVITVAWNVIKSVTSAVWNTVKGIISGGINMILGIIKVFSSLLTGNWRGAWEGVKQITRGAIQALGSIVNGVVDIGKNIIKGLIKGITSAASGLYEKAKEIARNVTKTIKNALGIHSPSRVMMELGEFTGIGFAEGIERSLSRINAAAYQLADYPVREVSSPTTTSATVSPQPAQRIVVEVPLYLDGHEIARATVDDINRLLGDRMNGSLRLAGIKL
jgi:TP901 family phage tail tape measure protein